MVQNRTAESYHAARSARDPAWREQQLLEARERERRRRERDPEGLRAARRNATRRTRARQTETRLTFHELWRRVGGDRRELELADAIHQREREEIRRRWAAGEIDY